MAPRRPSQSSMMNDKTLLEPSRLDRPDTLTREAPFHFLVATQQLPISEQGTLAADFPRYSGAGFFPYEEADCGPSVVRLVNDLTGREFADAIGRHLGLPDLGSFPTLITICRSLNKRHGTIHTDSRSKIATALLYLNADWPDISEGCLRFLKKVDDIDSLVVDEIRPLFGTIAAFRRADNSFHGHLPHEGERRVIQVAWLTSEEEKLRKTQRGKLSRVFKRLFGKLDKRFGAKRGRDASHPD